MADNISLELPGGVKVLNSDPLDPRNRVTSLTAIENNSTYYIGFSPIYNLDDNLTYKVSGGDANAGWEFEEDGASAVIAGDGLTDNNGTFNVGTFGTPLVDKELKWDFSNVSGSQIATMKFNNSNFSYIADQPSGTNPIAYGFLNNFAESKMYNLIKNNSNEIIQGASLELSSGLGVATLKRSSDLFGDTQLDVHSDRVEVKSTVPSFKGLVYNSDYSDNYTNRSLVDKEYVDSNSSSGSPIRSINQSFVVLDGTLIDIPLNDNVRTFKFNDNVIAQAFTVSGLLDTEEHTCKRIIDNSLNTEAVTLTWPSELIWDDSVAVTGPSGIAAGGKYTLEIEVESSTTAFALLTPRND